MREYDLTTITWRRPVFILTYGIWLYDGSTHKREEIIRVTIKIGMIYLKLQQLTC